LRERVSRFLREATLETERDQQRIVRLSRDDDGTEIWLDTLTGQELSGVVERREAVLPHPLIAMTSEVLGEFQWRSHLIGIQQVCCPVRASHASYHLCFQAYDDRPVLLCVANFGVNAPEEQRARALDYLNRANWGLRAGSFEMDPRDGEMRFRMTIDASGGAIVPEMVRSMVHTALGSCEHYFPGLMSVVFAGVEPAEAIVTAEQKGN
jgi:hypothetical protein